MEIKKELIHAHLDCVEMEIEEIKNEIDSIKISKLLSGTIVFKPIKCGKQFCRCMNGGPLHGPYPHLQTYVGGKIKTKYLNRKNFKEYKEQLDLCNRKRELEKRLKKLERKRRKLIKRLED